MPISRSKGAAFLIATALVALDGCRSKTCLVNADCHNGEVCSSGACVQPLDAGSCPGEAQPCTSAADCTAGACYQGCCTLASCHTDLDCETGQMCSGGVCKMAIPPPGSCQSDADCAAPTPRCLQATSSCVACLTTADCGDSRLVCTGNTCVYGLGACTHDSDCALLTATPACDATRHACVACTTATDCPYGDVCSPGELCIFGPTTPCAADTDCAATPATPVCDVASGLCTGCSASSGCPSGQVCLLGSCVTASSACQSDADCTDSAKPHCLGLTGQCVGCTSDGQCPPSRRCLQNSCDSKPGVTCASDNDCTLAGVDGFCDTTLGDCVECLSSSIEDECGAGVCQNDVCVQGCSGLLPCVMQCGTSRGCEEGCLANATATGMQLFQALEVCLFTGTCPDSGGEVCDSTASDYNSALCHACVSSAEALNGPCNAQLLACENN